MEDDKSALFYEGYIKEIMQYRSKTGKDIEFFGGEIEDIFITKKAEMHGGDSGGLCGACSHGKGLRVIMEFYERDLQGEIVRRAEDLVSYTLKYRTYLKNFLSYLKGLFLGTLLKIIILNRITSQRQKFGIS